MSGWTPKTNNEKASEKKAEVKETLKSETEAEKKAEVKPEVKKGKFPILDIKGNGWCEDLKRSYKTGLFKPTTKKEYEALKKLKCVSEYKG